MYLLRNGIMNYDWGSRDAIPRFMGTDPSDEPVAEVWVGTHGMNPSQVMTGASVKPLTDLAGDLPYLMKVLAADRPLSLQVHPSRSLAEAGFTGEEAEGVPVDAPHRSYRDRNAKSEMIYALSTFDALVGFRPTAELLRVLSPLRTALTDRLAEDLKADPGYAGIVRRVEWLLTNDVEPGAIHGIVDACGHLMERGLDVRRSYLTATEVAEHHPDDVGVLVAMLMNRMTLQPGEAVFLETGVLHAYLRGLGVEVMVNSDNVLRAGLTSKHIDRPSLIACLHAGMSRVARVTPDVVDTETEVFSPADVAFALAVTQVSHASHEGVELPGELGSLVICTGGQVVVSNEAGEKVTLRRGQSAYLSPKDGRIIARGLGEIAQAYDPHA